MGEPETIEEWAARVAHLLNADGWSTCNALAPTGATGALGITELLQWMVDHGAPEEPPMQLIRALLAYRNEVAGDLSADEKYGLFDSTDAEGAIADGLERIAELGLVCLDDDGMALATDFGREVARVLSEVPCA